MEDYEKPIPGQNCPACGGGLDRSTDILDENQSLDVGDVAICQHCGTILEVTPGFRFVIRTAEELRRHSSPKLFSHLMELQRAVRSRGQLLVTKGPEGHTVEAILPIYGREKQSHGRN